MCRDVQDTGDVQDTMCRGGVGARTLAHHPGGCPRARLRVWSSSGQAARRGAAALLTSRTPTGLPGGAEALAGGATLRGEEGRAAAAAAHETLELEVVTAAC